MATALQKKLATGKAKEYYQMEDSFEAWEHDLLIGICTIQPQDHKAYGCVEMY